MKYKIFEEQYKWDLEEELNDFAKNNEIQQISLAITKYGYENHYCAVVGYVSQEVQLDK